MDGVFSPTQRFGKWNVYQHLTGDKLWVVEDTTTGARSFFRDEDEAKAWAEAQPRLKVLSRNGWYTWY